MSIYSDFDESDDYLSQEEEDEIIRRSADESDVILIYCDEDFEDE